MFDDNQTQWFSFTIIWRRCIMIMLMNTTRFPISINRITKLYINYAANEICRKPKWRVFIRIFGIYLNLLVSLMHVHDASWWETGRGLAWWMAVRRQNEKSPTYKRSNRKPLNHTARVDHQSTYISAKEHVLMWCGECE